MSDPTYDLQKAIEKLEKFAQQNEAETHPLVFPVDRTIGLAQFFLSTQFSEKARVEQEKKRDLAQQEMLQAIAVVKRNYLLIQKLNQGTKEQQALAASAMQAVERYNEILLKTRQQPPTWSSRISRYVYDKCALTLSAHMQPIQIPQKASVQKNYCSASSKKIVSFIEDKNIRSASLLKHEEEAFRVKAISLLRNHGIRFTSTAEELSSIRTTPVQGVLQDQKRVVITQILKPFPGEVIEFKGEFERDESMQKSIPISHSFEVSTKSDQTGFPHPSQHNGWALSNTLVPLFPHDFSLLPKFHQMYLQKQDLAKELLPEGKWIVQARANLKLKKQIFNKNSAALLEKHRQLNGAILAAAEKDYEASILDRYFQTLKDVKNPFEYHSGVYELILFYFITRPYERIQEEWLHEKAIWNVDVKLRSQAILNLYNQEIERSLKELSLEAHPLTSDYMALMGPVLGQASSIIILQYLSENLTFPPQLFTDFALKVQTALYQQQLDFHAEFTHTLSLEYLQDQLDKDIAIFEADSFDDLDTPAAEIVQELEVYFNSRFFNN